MLTCFLTYFKFTQQPHLIVDSTLKMCYHKNAVNDLLTLFHTEWGLFIPQFIREGKMSTYIKTYRSLLDNDLLANDNTSYIVFTKILLRVNWKTGVLRTGRKKLGLMTNLKDTTAWASLHRLANDGMLTLRVTGRYTDIHICNWDKYQSDVDRPVDSSVRETRQPNDTINNNKRIKNIYGSEEPVDNSKKQKPEINEAFEYWSQTTGLEIVSQVKANRYACNNLLKKHGMEKLRKFIDGVKKAHQDQYAPRIADFIQLQSKLNELLLWGKRQNNTQSLPVGGIASNSGKFDHLKQLSRKELNMM